MKPYKAKKVFFSLSHREAGVTFYGKLINLPPINAEHGYHPVSEAEEEFLNRCDTDPAIHVTSTKPETKEMDPVKLWEIIDELVRVNKALEEKK